MATLSQLLVKISGDASGFKTAIGEATAAQRTLVSGIDSVKASILGMFAGFSVASFGRSVLDAKVRMDQLTMGLKTVAGSGAEANRQLSVLAQTAKLPGMSMTTAIEGVTRLQAAGIGFEKSERMVRAFGNALATVGGTGEDLKGVIIALTQIAATPFVQGDEIRQLQERLPQIRTLMVNAFGTARTEEIKKLGISSAEFLEKITKGAEGLAKASKTVGTSITQMGDQWTRTMAAIGNEVEGPIGIAIAALTKLGEALEKGTKARKDAQNTYSNAFSGSAAFVVAPPDTRFSDISKKVLSDQKFMQEAMKQTARQFAVLPPTLEEIKKAQQDAFDVAKVGALNNAARVLGATLGVDLKKRAQELKAQLDVVFRIGGEQDKIVALRAYNKALGELYEGQNKADKAAQEGEKAYGAFINKLLEGRTVSAVLAAELEKLSELDAFTKSADSAGDLKTRIEGITAALSESTKNQKALNDAIANGTVEASKFAKAQDLARRMAGVPLRGSEADENLRFDLGLTEEKKPRMTGQSLFFGINKEMVTGTAKEMSRAMQEVSTVVTDMSRGIADAIVNFKGFGDMGIKVAKDLATAIIRMLVQGALGDLAKMVFKTSMGLGSLGSIFKTGGKATEAVSGITGAVGDVAKKATGAVGAVASSSVMAVTGVVTGAISAVSGVIGNFQAKATNKSLDILVKHTLQLVMQGEAMSAFLRPQLGQIHDRLVQIVQSITGGGETGGAVAVGGGGTVNFNVYLSAGYYGTDSALDDLVTRIFDRARQQGLTK